MLPFVFLDESKLGPFHPFGIFVAIGFFVWDSVMVREAARRGFSEGDARALAAWVLPLGALTAWLTDAIFYHPAGQSVTSTLLSFQGFASTGGFVGAFTGVEIWRRIFIGRENGSFVVRRRASPPSLLSVSDLFVSTWPVAWAIGRVGCALIHDHPGVTIAKGTFGSLFALAWPTGPEDGTHHVLGPLHVVTGGSIARFDLGLLELVALAVIATVLLRMRRDVRVGTYTIVGALTYGPIRFALDFLRMDDASGGDMRHAGLTFAQYFSLAIVALGIALLVRNLRANASERDRAEVASTAGVER